MQERKILFVKLKKTLPGDAWRIIGTMLISNLVHAVRHREQLPEAQRHQFCIFVDEFQNFASSDDFAVLFTEARKYGIATTIAHQERYGQFADNRRIAGATLTAVNKVFFQVSVRDAQEQAPTFAKAPTTTETRLEPELVTSQEPFWDLLRRGHANTQIKVSVNKYFRPLYEKMNQIREEMETKQLLRTNLLEQSGLLRDVVQMSQADERLERQGVYDPLTRGFARPINPIAIESTRASIQEVMCVHHLSEEKASQLLSLFEMLKLYRQRIHNTDRFLAALMEQHRALIPEQEQYAQFFIDVLSVGYVAPCHADVLALYLQLEFGDPAVARSIPAIVAAKYYPQQLEDAYIEERRAFLTEHYKNVEADEDKRYGGKAGTTIMRDPHRTYFRHKTACRAILEHYRNSKINIDFNHPSIPVKKMGLDPGPIIRLPDLPPRRFSVDEATTIKETCYWEIARSMFAGIINSKPTFQLIDELKDFCQLFSKPENHIKVPSGQYIEKQVHVRPVHDMTDEMVQELIDLRPHTAYVKSTWKGKIQTFGGEQMPGGHLVDVSRIARQNAIDQAVLKPRSVIEAEIRERQDNWRKRGGNDLPPPTSTGGNSPPCLPLAGAGGGNEPPSPPDSSLRKHLTSRHREEVLFRSVDAATLRRGQQLTHAREESISLPPCNNAGRSNQRGLRPCSVITAARSSRTRRTSAAHAAQQP